MKTVTAVPASAKKEPSPAGRVPAHETDGRPPGAGLFRRRRFLIDYRTQLVSIVRVGLLVTALLVPINLAMHVIHTESAAQLALDAPERVRRLEAQNRLEAARLLFGSVVIVLATMSITLFSSHRTAGAAFRLCRGLEDLREGRYGTEAVLRRGDRLRNVERSLNDLSRDLLERSNRMAEELGRVAEAVRRVSEPREAEAAAERLRGMAQRLKDRCRS